MAKPQFSNFTLNSLILLLEIGSFQVLTVSDRENFSVLVLTTFLCIFSCNYIIIYLFISYLFDYLYLVQKKFFYVVGAFFLRLRLGFDMT